MTQVARSAAALVFTAAFTAVAVTVVAVTAVACKSGPAAHVVLPALAAATVTPPAPLAPPRLVTTVEGITEYALENGMRVLLFPDDSKDTVTVNATYFVGSRHEGYGETGMAHLLEHMLFKGTPTHPNVWKLLEDHGATFNGTTWTDRTNYYETLPATVENLDFALALEADRMVNSSIDPAQLATEFSVVRNEFEMGENNPVGILEERMLASAYVWHNYGKSTIGSRSDIERVPVENLRAFYQKFYQPDNAMLVVAGKFSGGIERTLAKVNDTFGRIPRPARKLSPTYTVEPVQDGERTVTLRRVGDVGVVALLYHTVPGSHAQFVPTEALVHLLTDEPSGRLYQALVKTGKATSVWGQTYSWAEPGALLLFAEVRQDQALEPVRDEMVKLVEGLAAAPITDEEVARYRAETRKDLKLLMANSGQLGVVLSEAAALGDWRTVFLYRDAVDAVASPAVRQAASDYLKSSNRTSGLFVPTKTPERSTLPEQPDVATLVKDYQGRPPIAEGEAFEATVANIEQRTTRLALPGGMKVALLPKETRGDQVRAVLKLRYGNGKDLEGKGLPAELVGELIQRGTTKRSYQQIKDELNRLEAKLSVNSEGGETGVSIVTVRDNLTEVLALAAEILRTPSFPADQFEIMRKERLASLEAQLSDPQAQVGVTLARALLPHAPRDVRYVSTTKESIDATRAVKLEEVKAFHAAFFGADHAELTVIGDFDRVLLEADAKRLFDGWRSAKKFARLETKFRAVAPSVIAIDTPDKEMAIIIAGHPIELRDDEADFAAATLANYVLGGSGASRLMNRLRQKEGLSYGAFAQLQVDSEDRFAIFLAGAILAPQNSAKGMALLLEETERFVKDGIPADELASAQSSYRKDFERSLASDGFVAAQLNDGLYLGRTLAFTQGVNDAIAKLGVDDVKRVIAKLYHPAKLVKITAADAKKATAPAPPTAPAK